MKTLLSIVAMALSVSISGCTKSTTREVEVDTVQLEKSFDTGDAQQKSSVNKIVTSLRAKDYAGAKEELKQLASNAKLTPEQRESIEGTMKKLGSEIKETAKKVADDAKEGFNKALNKEPAK